MFKEFPFRDRTPEGVYKLYLTLGLNTFPSVSVPLRCPFSFRGTLTGTRLLHGGRGWWGQSSRPPLTIGTYGLSLSGRSGMSVMEVLVSTKPGSIWSWCRLTGSVFSVYTRPSHPYPSDRTCLPTPVCSISWRFRSGSPNLVHGTLLPTVSSETLSFYRVAPRLRGSTYSQWFHSHSLLRTSGPSARRLTVGLGRSPALSTRPGSQGKVFRR